jgi:drug/metabolite transporter (DMT)-like permease
MIGFTLYFCAFLCWMTILKDIDLGRAFPMTASVYFGTVSAGVLIFHEHLTPLRIAGVVVIVAGIALLAFDRNSPKASVEPTVGPVHG